MDPDLDRWLEQVDAECREMVGRENRYIGVAYEGGRLAWRIRRPVFGVRL